MRLVAATMALVLGAAYAQGIPEAVPEPAEALGLFRGLFASSLSLVIFVTGVVEMLKKRLRFSGWFSVGVALAVSQAVVLLGYGLGIYSSLPLALANGVYIWFWAAGGYALVQEAGAMRRPAPESY